MKLSFKQLNADFAHFYTHELNNIIEAADSDYSLFGFHKNTEALGDYLHDLFMNTCNSQGFINKNLWNKSHVNKKGKGAVRFYNYVTATHVPMFNRPFALLKYYQYLGLNGNFNSYKTMHVLMFYDNNRKFIAHVVPNRFINQAKKASINPILYYLHYMYRIPITKGFFHHGTFIHPITKQTFDKQKSEFVRSLWTPNENLKVKGSYTPSSFDETAKDKPKTATDFFRTTASQFIGADEIVGHNNVYYAKNLSLIHEYSIRHGSRAKIDGYYKVITQVPVESISLKQFVEPTMDKFYMDVDWNINYVIQNPIQHAYNNIIHDRFKKAKLMEVSECNSLTTMSF